LYRLKTHNKELHISWLNVSKGGTSHDHINTANVFANKNILFTVVDYYKHGITKNAANSTLTLYHRVLKKL